MFRHAGQPGNRARPYAPWCPRLLRPMLNDIDMHSAKSTFTAAVLTLDLAGHLGCQGVHRQLHGTGQGTVEGPLNWLPVADIVIAVARAASTNPVVMSACRQAVVRQLRSLWRCMWTTRHSLSQDQSRFRRFGRWPMRRASCITSSALNAEPRSACGFAWSGARGG